MLLTSHSLAFPMTLGLAALRPALDDVVRLERTGLQRRSPNRPAVYEGQLNILMIIRITPNTRSCNGNH